MTRGHPDISRKKHKTSSYECGADLTNIPNYGTVTFTETLRKLQNPPCGYEYTCTFIHVCVQSPDG